MGVRGGLVFYRRPEGQGEASPGAAWGAGGGDTPVLCPRQIYNKKIVMLPHKTPHIILSEASTKDLNREPVRIIV